MSGKEDQRIAVHQITGAQDGVRLTAHLRLLDERDRHIEVFPRPGFDLIAEEAGDEDDLLRIQRENPIQHMLEHRLAGHADQRFRFGPRLRSQARAETGDGKNDVHTLLRATFE